MALTRAKKTQKVEALASELAGSTSAIVGTFTKLTVSQDFELRQKVREAGGRYRVLKNKLAGRASQGTGIGEALQGLKGVSSVAYTSGDPVALAKALSAWVKDNAEFTFKLGIVDGKVITVEQVQSLATMPSKDEIFAKLLFLISAPAQRLVTVVNAASRDLAVVINQGVEKGKFAEASAPFAAAQEPVEAAVVAVAVEPSPVEATPIAEVRPAVETAPAAEAAFVAEAGPVAEAEPAQVAVIEAPGAEAGEPAAESGTTNATDAIVAPSAAAESTEASVEAPITELSQAPAPAEGPAAEGSEAESQATQAEEAAGESPVEG